MTVRTPLVRVTRDRYAGGDVAREEDALAAEEPLEIRLNGQAMAVVMRTPGDDEELVRGFLVTEGVVQDPRQVESVKRIVNPLDEARANIVSARVPDAIVANAPWRRNFYASSSCGVCGKASLEGLRIRHPPVADGYRIARDALLALPDRLRAAQETFTATGGLHAAALADEAGAPIVVREDVGRHNAVDKCVGWAAMDGRLPASRLALMVSGRVSFEVVQKAVAAGVPLVAAVGAPSSLAVDVAREMNVTLVGFLRGPSFNVYTHPERIV